MKSSSPSSVYWRKLEKKSQPNKESSKVLKGVNFRKDPKKVGGEQKNCACFDGWTCLKALLKKKRSKHGVFFGGGILSAVSETLGPREQTSPFENDEITIKHIFLF